MARSMARPTAAGSLITENTALLAAVGQAEALLASRRRLRAADEMVEATNEATEADTLTEAQARRVAGPSGKLLLSFVNRVRLDFATTWVAHVRRVGLTNYLVGATDGRALRTLRRDGVPCFGMRTRLPEGEWAWGSPSFKSLGQHKVELVRRTLGWGLALIITDIDALVLREPFGHRRC